MAAWTHGRSDLPNGRHPPTLAELGARTLVVGLRRGLEISRGPYGGEPLFYTDAGEGPERSVLASSSLASLVRALPKPPPLDIDRLGAMALGVVGSDPRSTIYRGVFRALPCETIRFDAGGARRWFSLPPVPRLLPPDPRGHARAMRDALIRIVARELESLSAVAVSTGGGLDSGGLLALVARHAETRGTPRFTGITVDFAGPGDDRPYLVDLLEKLSATTLRVQPGKSGPLDPSFFTQDAAPYTWPTSPLDVVAGRRAKAWGAEAIVTGAGGDQILDGDDASFSRRARKGDLRAVLDAVRLQVPYRATRGRKFRRFIAAPLFREFLPRDWLARKRRRDLRRSGVAHWAGPRLRPQLEAVLSVPPAEPIDWLTSYATSFTMMEIADGWGQTESAWGIPQIHPYLDASFIELVASFPPEELFLGGWTRGLFREAMVGLLPESLRLRRDKAGFEPMVDGTFEDFGGFEGFRSLLTMEATGDLGLVDPVAFRGWFDRIARGERTRRGWVEVWPALTVEAFVRERLS